MPSVIVSLPDAHRRWSPARVAEVLDALGRRQREVPRWVVTEARGTVGATMPPVPAHDLAERTLLVASAPALLTLPAPRAVVHVGPAAPEIAMPLLDALLERGGVREVAAVDVSERVARATAVAIATCWPGVMATAVAADPSLRLGLPDDFARPRLYLCLGNGLGAAGTLGAVRLLRVLRAAMFAHDRLVLGLDLCDDRAALEDEGPDVEGLRARAARRVLVLLNRALGADFHPRQFDYRVTYDAEARRVDTCLVARRTMHVHVAGDVVCSLRKGESIRIATDCKYDRARLEALLEVVGLRLEQWLTDACGRAAIAVAAPAP